MIKKTLLIFFFFCLSTSLLLSQTDSDIPLNNEDADSFQISIGDSVPIADIPEEKESLGLFHRFKSFFNFYCSGEIDIKKSPEELYATALDSSNTLITAALDSSNTLITTALDSSNTLITTAQDSSGKILENAKNKAKEITSRAEVRQEFLNENSLLILSVFALLTISGLLIYVYHVWTWRKKIDNNSISLPETLRDDIDKVLKKVPLLSTKEEVKEYGKEVVESFNKVKDALPQFAEIIDETISGLDKKADQNYSEGLKLLRDQLELKEAKLSEKSNLKIKKKYILEVLEIKKRILFAKNNKSDELGDSFDIIIDKVDRFLKNEGVKVLSFEKGNALEKMLPFEFEKVESVQTNSDSLDQTICETVEIGYYLEAPNDKKAVIIPAKVSIYVPIQESESVE